MALLTIVLIAVLALTGWSMSVRRCGAPRRDAQFFLLASVVDDAPSAGNDARAELIEEKHHLELRATLPALTVGAAAAAGAIYIVLGDLQPTRIPELGMMTAELAVIALGSIAVAAICARRTARVVVRQSQIYRRSPH